MTIEKTTEVTVLLDDREVAVPSGLVRGAQIVASVGAGDRRLRLLVAEGQEVEVLPEDHLLLSGGERFVGGEPVASEDSRPPAAVRVFLNGAEVECGGSRVRGGELKKRDEGLPDGRLFAETASGPDFEVLDSMMVLVRDGDRFFVVPGSEDGAETDEVDLERCGRHGRRPPRGFPYRIRVDGDRFRVEMGEMFGAEILALVEKTPEDWLLNQKIRGGRRLRIAPDEIVDFTALGIERFETVRKMAPQGQDGLR